MNRQSFDLTPIEGLRIYKSACSPHPAMARFVLFLTQSCPHSSHRAVQAEPSQKWQCQLEHELSLCGYRTVSLPLVHHAGLQ